LYSLEGWEKFQNSLLALSSNSQDARKHVRLIVGSASALDFDKQGRINLPSNLLEHAGAIKECVVVGVLDHIEIWSKEVWDKYLNEAADSMEDVAERLTTFGK